MIRQTRAILTVFAIFSLLPAGQEGQPSTPKPSPIPSISITLDKPLAVRFSLTDGVRISGKLTHWDHDSIHGTFSSRKWTELKPADIRRIHHRLIDLLAPPDPATDDDHPPDSTLTPSRGFINLGRIMLLVGEGKYAEKAFRHALRLDAHAQAAIATARTEVAQFKKEQADHARAVEDARLITLDPEAKSWPPAPWPPLSGEDYRAASLTMRADAEAILERAGLGFSPYESQYFLLYTDLSPQETKRWAQTLDQVIRRLNVLFRLPSAENVLWGRPVAFIFQDRDQFDLFEADEFNYLHPASVSGVTHCIGPKSFLVLNRNLRGGDDRDFTAHLVHEGVHAFMHRYQTPHRPPPWINEGLALVLADGFASESPLMKQKRDSALDFIRQSNDPAPVLNLTYSDLNDSSGDRLTSSLGWLLSEFLMRDDPRAYVKLIQDIKHGHDWISTLRKHYKASPQAVIDAFARYYRVND